MRNKKKKKNTTYVSYETLKLRKFDIICNYLL